nr:hypothetical protein [Glycomyces tenuis]
MDLLVPVQCRLTRAAGRSAGAVEAVGQFGDRLLQVRRDGGEMPLVVGDQLRIGLAGEGIGKIECAGVQGLHLTGRDR